MTLYRMKKLGKFDLVDDTERALFVDTIGSVLLHSSETWTLTDAEVKSMVWRGTCMFRNSSECQQRDHMCNADLYVGLPSLSQNCNETHWACCPLRPSRAVRSEYPSSMKSNTRHCLKLKTLAARVSVKCTSISRRTVPSGAQGTFTVITC